MRNPVRSVVCITGGGLIMDPPKNTDLKHGAYLLLYFYPERPALNARSLFGASTGLYMPETDKNDTAESSSAAVPTYSGDSAKDKSKFTGWKALVENWLSGYIGVDEGDLKEHPLPHPLSYYVFERPERPARHGG